MIDLKLISFNLNNLYMVHFVTILVTRNKSVHVRTLHTALYMNVQYIQAGIEHEICFVNDDPFEKSDMILKKLKTSDRLVFIDYSVNIDQISVQKLIEKFDPQCNCLIFPCIKEGIDWEQFKHKISNKIDEPIDQMGLNFDTTVGQKLSDGIYKVTKTNPKCWVMDSKSVLKHLKTKKKEQMKQLPAKNDELFETLQLKGVKLCAYTEAKLTIVFSHECIGNILNAAGVKVN